MQARNCLMRRVSGSTAWTDSYDYKWQFGPSINSPNAVIGRTGTLNWTYTIDTNDELNGGGDWARIEKSSNGGSSWTTVFSVSGSSTLTGSTPISVNNGDWLRGNMSVLDWGYVEFTNLSVA